MSEISLEGNPKERREKCLQMGRNLEAPNEIATRLEYSNSAVYTILRNAKIYTRGKAISMLKDKTDEEIATEGHVDVEAVARLRRQIEKKEEEKGELAERRKKCIQMGRNLDAINVIVERLEYTEMAVYIRLKKAGIYTRGKVISMLKDKTNEEIATEGNVDIEAVARLREEISKKATEKESEFLQMARDLEKPNEIAKRLEFTTTNPIYERLRKAGIYTKSKVISMLRYKTDEEISAEGNVNIEAVARVRREIEEQKQNRKQRKKLTKRVEKEAELLQMAKDLEAPKEIAKRLGYNRQYIYIRMREEGVYTRCKVISMLGYKTNEEIATEGHVDVEAVARLRKMREERESSKKRTNEALRQKNIMQYKEEVRRLLKSEFSINYIAYKTRLTVDQVSMLRQEIEQEYKSKTVPTEQKQVGYKIERLKLHSMIKNITEPKETTVSIIDLRINKMLLEYSEFLTQEDYALFAYGYVKVREYLKAIQFGEQYLNLDELSLSALKARLDEILNNNEAKEKSEVQQSKVHNHPNSSEGHGDR